MTIFICPTCKIPSSGMKLLKNSKYAPGDEKNIGYRMPHIEHELSRCPCGRLLTWFDMIEITVSDPHDNPYLKNGK